MKPICQMKFKIAEKFFGGASEGLASVIEKAFSDMGRPIGFIAGEEISGVLAVRDMVRALP